MNYKRYEELMCRINGKTDDEIAEIIANEYPEILISSLIENNPKGFTEEQIAEQLGMTVGEVRLYLYSGMKKIKDRLK